MTDLDYSVIAKELAAKIRVDLVTNTAILEQVSYTETCTVRCKFCGSNDVVKNGVRTGNIQYYLCHDCKRTFAGNNALEGMKYPPDRIATAITLFYDGLSIDKIRRRIDDLFHSYTSDSTVYEWIVRYSKIAVDKTKSTHITVGNYWVGDETVLKLDKGVNAWFWDIIDDDTRFLLASHMSLTRTTNDAQILMENALEQAGKIPKIIFTDRLRAYLDGIELTFGSNTKHIQGSPFDVQNNTNKIERFHSTLKSRTEIMRGMQNPKTAMIIMDGWLVNYNYFRPHEGIGNKTPAVAAKSNYPYKNWLDVVTNNSIKGEACRWTKTPLSHQTEQ
jgi:putative transposase